MKYLVIVMSIALVGCSKAPEDSILITDISTKLGFATSGFDYTIDSVKEIKKEEVFGIECTTYEIGLSAKAKQDLMIKKWKEIYVSQDDGFYEGGSYGFLNDKMKLEKIDNYLKRMSVTDKCTSNGFTGCDYAKKELAQEEKVKFTTEAEELLKKDYPMILAKGELIKNSYQVAYCLKDKKQKIKSASLI